MKQILVIHLNEGDETTTLSFLGQQVQLRRMGCGGNVERARTLIHMFDGTVAAIGLEGLPAELHLGHARRAHELGGSLPDEAKQTPVVDGAGIRDGLERWGIILAERTHPGLFGQKRVLMVPGLNHEGLAQALGRRASALRYADPEMFFALPAVPGVGSQQSLEQVAGPTLDRLQEAPFRLLSAQPGQPHVHRDESPFRWADVLAGDIGAIRRYAPAKLPKKIVVAEHADDADEADLRGRGVSVLVTLMPPVTEVSETHRQERQGREETEFSAKNLGALGGLGGEQLGRHSAATMEALLVALRPDPNAPLNEDTYLDLMADIQWTPTVRYLQPEEAGINKFAFAIHPLDISFLHAYKPIRWTRYLPDALVENVAAYFPPLYVGKITGGVSPTTGQRIEGYLISLGATPRQMMKHNAKLTYKRLNQSAKIAERKGARIMGLGAFTSVVGDAGITVAHEADIAITSGNSLTVAATLEAAKQAVQHMGVTDLTKGKAMIIGATGSIGSVCARLLAQAVRDVVLVSIEPEKLIELKRTIQRETPGCEVVIATKADELVGECDLIVTATSAFGQRIVNITRCKPGAVVCDVARPPDISAAEAALRPDVLVIESGEVRIPGDVEVGYNIGLPPKTVYACLAETALLAMEGKFEDYTLGRNITMERVKEIYRLFKKHGFQLAGLRSFGKFISDEDFAAKRALAAELLADRERFAQLQAETGAKLASMPRTSKGVSAKKGNGVRWGVLGAAVGAAALGAFWRLAHKK
ncbi:MAG: serine carboxypeptidase [Chloroflexaceae bacterium]|nr:serine carboxypeptidase [Chloroflexaceae bacterium]